MRPQPPEATLRKLRGQATVHTTPCDHGELQWLQWTCPEPDGPPLVLLHGGFGSWNHWVRNIPGLRERRTVWAVDLPGLGDSADLPEPRVPEHFARVLLRGIDSLLGPSAEFELAGFSFGAMVAARLAVLAGTRCRRIVLIGAAGFGALHVQVPLQRPPGPDTAPEEARSIHHANLRALMFSGDEHIDELALYCHADNLARHRFNSRRLSLTDDLIQALPAIRGTLVGIWGSRDATVGGRPAIEKRRDLLRAVQPDCAFYILDGVGHWAMYEAPEQINHLLLAG